MERFLLILLSSGFLSILSSFIPTIVLAQTKLLVDYNLTLEVESAVLARMELKTINEALHLSTVNAILDIIVGRM